MYLCLDDILNWKQVKIKEETTYYYLKNHTFKIIQTELEDTKTKKYSKSVKTAVENYSYALDYISVKIIGFITKKMDSHITITVAR